MNLSIRRILTSLIAAILLCSCSSVQSAELIQKKSDLSSAVTPEESSDSTDDSTITVKTRSIDKFDTCDENTEIADPDGWYSFTYENLDEVYSNDKLESCFERLNEIIASADYNLSFSYENLDSGAEISYQPDYYYLTCSTVKATYVKNLLERNVNLDDVLYNDGSYYDDESIVTNSRNKSFTTRQLIEYAITYSDNTAYSMLVQNYGYTDFNEMLSNIGAEFRLSEGVIWTYCTSDDMMKCFEDIYSFAEENENGQWLVDLLSDTKMNTQIGAALGDKYTVAQKYGSEFNEYSFHDCAIVYADSPFVLTIFTTQYPETEESCKVFKELAEIFDEINSLLVTS